MDIDAKPPGIYRLPRFRHRIRVGIPDHGDLGSLNERRPSLVEAVLIRPDAGAEVGGSRGVAGVLRPGRARVSRGRIDFQLRAEGPDGATPRIRARVVDEDRRL